MVFKIKGFFLLIFLILLQSCSGGRIANFLEASFENLENKNQAENSKNALNDEKVFSSEKRINNTKKIKRSNKNLKKRKNELQSYKIIFVKWISHKRNIALVYFPDYLLEMLIILYSSVDIYCNKIYKVKYNKSDKNLLEFIY